MNEKILNKAALKRRRIPGGLRIFSFTATRPSSLAGIVGGGAYRKVTGLRNPNRIDLPFQGGDLLVQAGGFGVPSRFDVPNGAKPVGNLEQMNIPPALVIEVVLLVDEAEQVLRLLRDRAGRVCEVPALLEVLRGHGCRGLAVDRYAVAALGQAGAPEVVLVQVVSDRHERQCGLRLRVHGHRERVVKAVELQRRAFLSYVVD